MISERVKVQWVVGFLVLFWCLFVFAKATSVVSSAIPAPLASSTSSTRAMLSNATKKP